MTIALWWSVVQKELDTEDILLFPSSPRKMAEVNVMDDLANGTHRPLPVPIYLDISEEEARRRLLNRGRNDDTLEVINNRLRNFNEQVLPLVDFYGNRVVRVDGNGPKEEVNERLMYELLKK